MFSGKTGCPDDPQDADDINSWSEEEADLDDVNASEAGEE